MGRQRMGWIDKHQGNGYDNLFGGFTRNRIWSQRSSRIKHLSGRRTKNMDSTDGGGINKFNPDTRKFNHILPTWGDKVSSITGIDKRRLLISLFSKGIFFFDKETEEYQPLIIVNDSINTLLCQRGKNVNVLQNTPETVLLLSESPYSYHLTKKKFTPIVSVGKQL